MNFELNCSLTLESDTALICIDAAHGKLTVNVVTLKSLRVTTVLPYAQSHWKMLARFGKLLGGGVASVELMMNGNHVALFNTTPNVQLASKSPLAAIGVMMRLLNELIRQRR